LGQVTLFPFTYVKGQHHGEALFLLCQ